MAERRRPARERTGPHDVLGPGTATEHPAPNRDRRSSPPDPGRPTAARRVPRIQIGQVSVTATNGNQEAESVTETGRRIGVEVTERDHDDDGEQGERCDQPGRPTTTRHGPNLHPKMPHWRCKQTQGLKLRPESHFQSHPPYPISPSISIRSPPNLPLPGAAHWYRGEVGERPTAKLTFCGPGRCSSVTPAGSGRSPRSCPCGKARSTAGRERRRVLRPHDALPRFLAELSPRYSSLAKLGAPADRSAGRVHSDLHAVPALAAAPGPSRRRAQPSSTRSALDHIPSRRRLREAFRYQPYR